MATSTTSSRIPAETTSPAMRDRQARGRDPYSVAEDSVAGDDDDVSMIMDRGQRVRKHHETWEQKEKTGFATRILSNPDLLLWHAQAQGDSVTAQRLRFTAMLCGYEDFYETGHSRQGNAADESSAAATNAHAAGSGAAGGGGGDGGASSTPSRR